MKNVETHPVTVELEQDKLHQELEDMKQKLNIGHELAVKWVPTANGKLSGEVKGECIFVYEVDEKKALETLKHEFLDYVISKVAEPYQRIANRLIELTNEETYKRKEKLVECLCKLL
jgi:hypothetical protein